MRRHLLSGTASLEFDPYLGKFTVGPSTEGARFASSLTCSIQSTIPKTRNNCLKDGDQDLTEITLGIGRRSIQLLKAIANSLPARGDGEYFGDGLEPIDRTPSEKPVVEFAPALNSQKTISQES